MPRTISPAKQKEIDSLFQLYDVDTSGFIDVKELGTIIRALGLIPTNAQIGELLKAYDKNGNGKLSKEEFTVLYQDEQGILPDTSESIPSDVERAFRAFDRDGSGKVSRAELTQALKSRSESMSDEELATFFSDIPEDKTEFNAEEFYQLVTGEKRKTVLITGASTGFGKLTAQRFFAEGWNVVATMRNTTAGEELVKLSADRVLVTTLDVQKQDTIDAAVAATIEKFGKIDVLINNAGYGSIGFFEGAEEQEFKRQFDINNVGVLRVTKAVLPYMRKERSGNIVCISSAAGGHTNIASSLYTASKFALEGWAETMSYELLPFNIQVKIVQPGGYKTDFATRSLQFNAPPADVPEYAAIATNLQAMLANVVSNLPDPSPVIDTIFDASIEKDSSKMRFPIWEEADKYGALYNLRKAQGDEANMTAVMTALNPEGKGPEAQPDLAGAQTVLITGASTGFGKLVAEDFAAKGWNVVATMRKTSAGEDLAKLPNVLVLELDVQKQDTIDKAVATTIEKFGKIDVLVNNAGYASFGFVEGTDASEFINQFDINVYGVFRVTKAVLPHMRKAKFGQIVNVSSCAAGHTAPLSSTYYCSKWALDGWAECLAYELAPFNIQVKLVQPGGFKTEIFKKLVMAMPPGDVPEYLAQAQKMQEGMGAAMAALPEPKPLVTDAIYKASINRNPVKIRYAVFADTDMFGQLYMLRKSQGPEAQYAAVLASQQPKKE